MMSLAQELTQVKVVNPSLPLGWIPKSPGGVFKNRYIDLMGLNSTQMAKSLGVRWATMSETLTGKRRLSLKMAAKFAEYSGESILYWYQMQVNLDVWNLERELRGES